MAAGEIDVRCSPTALEQMRLLKRRGRASPGTVHEKRWNAIREAVTKWLGDPDVARHADHALRGDLVGVYRIKLGRDRVFYLCNGSKTVVLYLGWRKEGDKQDAYTEMTRRVRGGAFDDQFKELGVAKPV